jgi:hypothetical protein
MKEIFRSNQESFYGLIPVLLVFKIKNDLPVVWFILSNLVSVEVLATVRTFHLHRRYCRLKGIVS